MENLLIILLYFLNRFSISLSKTNGKLKFLIHPSQLCWIAMHSKHLTLYDKIFLLQMKIIKYFSGIVFFESWC